MASIRKRERADGTVAIAVLYTLNGQQTSATFDTNQTAQEFRDAVNSIGAERAMKAWGITPTVRAANRSTAPTVTEWLNRYIDSRTGVTKACLYDYRSYLKHDIKPVIGDIPLDLLTVDDISDWVQHLQDRGLAGKTIGNRHGFLSAALNTAVRDGVASANPALGTRLPRSERPEMIFLDHDEFDLFRSCFTARWWPQLDFMVTSGARFGELTALRPSDVDRKRGTVHIARSWKRTYDEAGYELGAPKTRKSVRTLSIDKELLEQLDYSGEYLFTNTVDKPVRASSFRNNVWYPAVRKARELGLEKKPRIHDMRHTCASWLIQGGESPAVVQAHLGHENINTTISLYAHLDRSSFEQAAKVLSRGLSRAPSD